MAQSGSNVSVCLWFDGAAEEAATFYTALVPNSGITNVNPSTVDYPGGKAGDVITVSFTLDGQSFLGLNGHTKADYGTAASIMVLCDSQAEIDRLWEALLKGGEPMACGWLTDRFGVPWQVVPRRLMEITTGPDRAASKRAMEAMMPMVKLDLAEIEAAAAG